MPAYLKEQGFPRDKPAKVPGRHLDHEARCGIHAERSARGSVVDPLALHRDTITLIRSLLRYSRQLPVSWPAASMMPALCNQMRASVASCSNQARVDPRRKL